MDTAELTEATKVYCENLANYLRSKGYIVLPKERRVVVATSYRVNPWDMEAKRFNEPRYEDMVRSTNLRKLIQHADDNGFIIHAKRDLNDPVTGREVVFTSDMGLIVPKAADEV